MWAYWRVLMRHRWTVLTVLLGAVLAPLIWGFITPPVFTATALLRVEREEPRVVKFEQVVRDDLQGESPLTQLHTFQRLLQSRTLANRVIGRLGLERHPEFREPPNGRGNLTSAFLDRLLLQSRTLANWLMGRLGLERHPEFREPPNGRGNLTSAFLDRLQVDPIRNARLVKVSFWSHHPELSAGVANTLIDEFMAHHVDQKVEATRSATAFLSKQKDDARRKLETAETLLSDFLTQNDIQFVGVDRSREPLALINQQLATLSEALLKARAERVAKESAFNNALSAETGAISPVLQAPLISHLKEETAALGRKYRELGQTFKPDYPRLQRLAQNMSEVRAQVQEETRRVIDAISSDYQVALQNEIELQKLVDEQRRLARKLDGQMVRYNLLRREAETSRELYTALSSRLNETQIAASLLTSNISIVDRAEVPLTPVGSRMARKLLLGGLVGLVAGVVLAFFLERLDTRIRDAHEVEAILHVPMLGWVPARSAVETSRPRELPRNRVDRRRAFALVTHEATNSLLAEAFRNVRTSVMYSAQAHPPRTMMVTSLQQQDGATSVSTNCAISFAQLQAGDVLLIDANMRNPSLHALLGVPGAPGLSDLLGGTAELAKVITNARRWERRIPGLYVIPAGPVPMNPVELLASPRFAQVLATLTDRFAHIVIDAPPMFGVSDVRVLAPQVEGVILVLRHGRASRDAAQQAVRMLASVRARLLGVVLNRVNSKTLGWGAYGYPSDNNNGSHHASADSTDIRRADQGGLGLS
jgi:polysaccharide biosynthesis transport protein